MEKKLKGSGAMRAVARLMGYQRIIDIPDGKISDFVYRLVEQYGYMTARSMIQRRLLFRKSANGEFKRKLELMWEAI